MDVINASIKKEDAGNEVIAQQESSKFYNIAVVFLCSFSSIFLGVGLAAIINIFAK
jgi:hypothetical protein